MMKMARSFTSYIKHGERAKLTRRAIAPANVILRMFLHIVEEFHLTLSKSIQGSTIVLGGEEKKRKIFTSLQSASLQHMEFKYRLQATQDATKWNECKSPELFTMLHSTYFHHETRQDLGLPMPNPFEQVFQQMCLTGHFSTE